MALTTTVYKNLFIKLQQDILKKALTDKLTNENIYYYNNRYYFSPNGAVIYIIPKEMFILDVNLLNMYKPDFITDSDIYYKIINDLKYYECKYTNNIKKSDKNFIMEFKTDDEKFINFYDLKYVKEFFDVCTYSFYMSDKNNRNFSFLKVNNSLLYDDDTIMCLLPTITYQQDVDR